MYLFVIFVRNRMYLYVISFICPSMHLKCLSIAVKDNKNKICISSLGFSIKKYTQYLIKHEYVIYDIVRVQHFFCFCREM